MKSILLILLFWGLTVCSYAQFQPNSVVIGGSLSGRLSQTIGFNQQQFSFSPTIQHWSSARWSHNWGLDYNLVRLNAAQNAFIIHPSLLAKKARFHTFYADYSLRHWGKAWVENSLKPYSFVGIGLGFGLTQLKNNNATQEFWTYNGRLKAGLGLFWQVSPRLGIDFQFPIFSTTVSYDIDTKAFAPNIQLNPLQSNWRLGIFYPINK